MTIRHEIRTQWGCAETIGANVLKVWHKSESATIQMKAIDHYFHLVLLFCCTRFFSVCIWNPSVCVTIHSAHGMRPRGMYYVTVYHVQFLILRHASLSLFDRDDHRVASLLLRKFIAALPIQFLGNISSRFRLQCVTSKSSRRSGCSCWSFSQAQPSPVQRNHPSECQAQIVIPFLV